MGKHSSWIPWESSSFYLEPKSMVIGETSPCLANKPSSSPTRSLKASKSRKEWTIRMNFPYYDLE
jgi:hypothetical protein